MAAETLAPAAIRPDIPGKLRIVFYLLMFLPAFFVQRVMNNDIWFLLASGRHVLAHGFPVTEPLALHEGLDFVMQQWLSAVIFQTAYASWGEAGLFAVVSLMYALIILAIFRLALRVSGNSFFLSYLVTSASSLWAYLFMTTRPYIFSTLILILEIYLIETALRSGKKGLLAGLPLLSALLVNLHAAMWPMFLVMLLPYLAETLVQVVVRKLGQAQVFGRALISAALVSTASALANPYGWKAMTYLFRSYGHPEISKYISEMLPLNINLLSGKVYFSAMGLILLLLGLRSLKVVRLRYLFLLAGLLYLGVSSLRNNLLFSVLGFFPLADTYASASLALPATGSFAAVTGTGRTRTHRMSRGLLRGLIAALLVLLLVLSAHLLVREEQPEVPAYTHLLAILKQVKTDAATRPLVLYTGYNDGGHAEFIGLKPYLDPRAEVFVLANNGQKDIMAEFVHLQTGKIHYRDFIDRYRFTDLVLGPKDILRVYLPRDPEYELVRVSGEYVWYRQTGTR
ncbi:MAG: hypothetical protein EOM70_01745 [Clostridia bacterium]|nr:hypothetical protein [Clostridia bacterium]